MFKYRASLSRLNTSVILVMLTSECIIAGLERLLWKCSLIGYRLLVTIFEM